MSLQVPLLVVHIEIAPGNEAETLPLPVTVTFRKNERRSTAPRSQLPACGRMYPRWSVEVHQELAARLIAELFGPTIIV
jgi:hypothetical protein